MDELLAHLYGEATPWPSESERIEVMGRLHNEASDLTDVGGRVLAMDCESWPCIMVMELQAAGLDAAIERVRAAVPSARPFAFIEDEPGVQRILVEQDVEDVSPWDPHLLLRKDDLLILVSQPEVDPASPEAQQPLAPHLRDRRD